MNKKIFLKLGLLLLSVALVSCGVKNNSIGEDNSSKVTTNKSFSSTQGSGEESIKTKPSSVENATEKDGDIQKSEQPDIQEDTQQDTQQELTEDEYYRIIKEAWQKQKDYIDSIDDPKEKQSIQTSQSAAIMESNRFLIEHPEDSEAIETGLKRVINGE